MTTPLTILGILAVIAAVAVLMGIYIENQRGPEDEPRDYRIDGVYELRNTAQNLDKRVKELEEGIQKHIGDQYVLHELGIIDADELRDYRIADLQAKVLRLDLDAPLSAV